MPKVDLTAYKVKIATEIVRMLSKAPRGKRGARGSLIHLQDPEFVTDDPHLLMTRPTRPLTRFVETVADRVGVSRPLVKTVIDEMQDSGTVMVSKSRKINGIPTLIPIKFEKEHRTGNIGTFRDGQFVGFSFSLGRDISVLHIFDKFGFHVESFAWNSETGCDAEEELDKAIGSLFRPYPGDIQIQLFETELLGQTFGLVKSDKEHVEYIPLGFGFDPPWNGCYNT